MALNAQYADCLKSKEVEMHRDSARPFEGRVYRAGKVIHNSAWSVPAELQDARFFNLQ
jgi:hypothetical protein